MDPDELQSDLLALRRLYGLLVNDQQYAEDASSENLDKNARQLQLNLLNDAADKSFKAHSKMLGSQYITSYNPWSMPKEQSSDGLNPQPFCPSNASTDFPSLQQVDYSTGESIFSDPMNQRVFSGHTNSISNSEHNVKLKRCRACQKPTVKQLTKEMSIQDRNVLTLKNISQQQNRERSWEVQNDPSRTEDSALTFDNVKSLALINLTDEEDQISREASTRILQIESRISSLQVAVKRINLVDFDFGSQKSQMGPTVTGQTGSFVVVRNDLTNSRMGSSDSEGSFGEVYSGSIGSGDHEESESVMYSLSSQDHSADMSSSTESSESEPKLTNTVPKKGKKSGIKKKLSMSTSSETSGSKSKSKSWKTVLAKGHNHDNTKSPKSSSGEFSGSESKSNPKLKETVPTKGHKGGNREEPKRSSSESSLSQSKSKSRTKSKEIRPTKVHKGSNKKEPKSTLSESSGEESNSKPKSLEIVPITGDKRGTSEFSVSKSKFKKPISTKYHKKDAKTEPKMSRSSDSSGLKSKKMVPAKNHKTEAKKDPKIKQVRRLAKLKDKLAIIFHHHHYHHYHHHHHPNDEDRQQDPVDKDHRKHPDDKDRHHHSDDKDHHKVHSKAIVGHKLEDKKQKGHSKTLVGGVGGLIKHANHAKKSKKSKSGLKKIPTRKSGKIVGGKVGKKMQWWDMLCRQRKIKRIEKLRSKIAK